MVAASLRAPRSTKPASSALSAGGAGGCPEYRRVWRERVSSARRAAAWKWKTGTVGWEGEVSMARIALIVGIIFAAAGLMAIAFGVPNKDFSVGSTAIVSGTMLLSGGLILIGLSAVVTELRRIGALLEDRDMPPLLRETPGPDISAGLAGAEPAIVAEMAREPASRPRHRDMPLPPVSPPPQLETEGLSDFLAAPRGTPREEVDAPRARRKDQPASGEPSGHLFDSLWPARQDSTSPRRGRSSAPHEMEDRASAERAPQPDTSSRPNVTIIKSGIVDGMAYTLFSDGSIEAELSNGPVRFASINELRAHLEGRG